MSAFALLYAWRPFALGFYSDDWGHVVEPARFGAPFSWERLRAIAETVPYGRPLQVPEQFFFSSLLGDSSLAWHLLLVALVAVSAFLLYRFLVALGSGASAATWGAALWLVLPWSLGYTAWPVAVPLLLALACFLEGSVQLLRLHLGRCLVWYTMSLLLYEAFYFQFLVILAFLYLEGTDRRWLTRAGLLLAAQQLAAVAFNRYAAYLQPGYAKHFSEDWPLHWGETMVRLPWTLTEGIQGGPLPRAVFAGLLVLLLASFGVGLLRGQVEHRGRLLVPVGGLAIAVAVLTAAGYGVSATGLGSRTFLVLNVWLAVAAVLLLARDRRRRAAYLAPVAAGLFLLAAGSMLVQAAQWHEWWVGEREVLARFPAESLEITDARAIVLVVDVPYVGPHAVFGDSWGLGAAMRSVYPGAVGKRAFVPVPESSPGREGRYPTKASSIDRMMAAYKARERWIWRYPEDSLSLAGRAGQ